MSPNDIKKGTVIRFNGDLWIVMDFQRVSPGKGSSFVRTKMKNLKTGKAVENNFKSAENLEFEDVQYKKMQYLFTDGNLYTFMDNQTYEQVTLSASDIGDDVKYLKEGIEVTILTYNDLPLTIQLPKKIEFTVKDTEPAVKGDTASGNVTKEAFMDNGLMVKVPIFVSEGDVIIVNTEDGSYAERVAK
ncbi:elongation factor P [Patescibacteria group bacterium]|nr:MAG: elongation factor P [Patescibacteria group bacterium]